MSRSPVSACEFLSLFPEPESVRLHTEKLRWEGYPVCPRCGSDGRITVRRGERFGYHRYRDCEQERHAREEYVCRALKANGIESVWVLLSRGIYGTWHHIWGKHLHRYLNEVAFRLNEADVRVHTLSRFAAFARRAFGCRLAYRNLVALGGAAAPPSGEV